MVIEFLLDNVHVTFKHLEFSIGILFRRKLFQIFFRSNAVFHKHNGFFNYIESFAYSIKTLLHRGRELINFFVYFLQVFVHLKSIA